jgi:hypothetical protein
MPSRKNSERRIIMVTAFAGDDYRMERSDERFFFIGRTIGVGHAPATQANSGYREAMVPQPASLHDGILDFVPG